MRGNGYKSGLAPALKSWLDNVVVPALVREYVAEHGREISPCTENDVVAESAPESRAEEVR